MKTFKKSVTVAAILAAGSIGALAPEEALAHRTGKAHKHRQATSAAASSSSPSVDRRLRALEDEITSLRAELSRARSTARTEGGAKVQEIEARQQQLEQQVA